MIKIGDTNISKLYIGTTECIRAYQGNDIVYGDEPFITFTSNTSGSTIGLVNRSSNQTTLEYSRDKITWTDMTTGMTPETLDSGDELYVRGVLTGANSSSNYTQFDISNGDVSVSGDIRNLWNYNNLNQPLKEEAGRYLFASCIALTDTSNLCVPIANAYRCYYLMFQYCTSLTTVPQLPSTALADMCYGNMFQGCTSLTTVPSNMLPATELFDSCYAVMFHGCSSLTTAPNLPATTLKYSCYNSMFSSCTSLITAPELSATTLTNYCYTGMFQGCTSLITAPELSATTLTDSCYRNMFYNCTSLATAPELPATTLADHCYDGMFYNCTSLTTAPSILPATTLAEYCYYGMFRQCRLITAPELPATVLAPYCYKYMFRDSSLNYIKCLATDISAIDCTDAWLLNVATAGTFVKESTMTSWTTGYDGIPSGWNVVDNT